MEVFAVAWWMWLVAGLLLCVCEILTPGGFYIIFFGLGAIVTGVLAALGFPATLTGQGLLFGIVSAVSLVLFRKPILQRFSQLTPAAKVDRLEDETAVALDDIPPQQAGKAELRGTGWSAQNVGDEAIAKGQRCRVERVEGLTLYLRPR